MAWISTTNGNPARDRNSYCALSLLPRSNGTQCDGGGQRKEWKIETARLRGFGYPELYFSSMRKNGRGRVPITMDRGCGHGERAAVKRDTKEEGKKKRRKSRWTKRRWEESFSKLTHIPRFVRRWYPRFVQRINVLGAGLSAVIFLSSPRLDSGGIHSDEWMNMCALSLSFSPYQHQVPN